MTYISSEDIFVDPMHTACFLPSAITAFASVKENSGISVKKPLSA